MLIAQTVSHNIALYILRLNNLHCYFSQDGNRFVEGCSVKTFCAPVTCLCSIEQANLNLLVIGLADGDVYIFDVQVCVCVVLYSSVRGIGNTAIFYKK